MPTDTIEGSIRVAFQKMAMSGRGDAGALAVGLRTEVTGVGLRALAAKLLHVAVYAPGRLIDVYDGAAHGWLSGQTYPPSTRGAQHPGPSSDFWQAFWRAVDAPAASRLRQPFTDAMIGLAKLAGSDLNRRVADAALDFPGVAEAVAAGVLDRPDMARLAQSPPAAFGGFAYREIVARGGLAIDAGDLALDELPPVLGYLNTRVLECDGVWAALAGYGQNDLDELGFAAFKLAQFGHHYSAILLALALATVAFERPPRLELVLESVFMGWMHGRQTPPLLGVRWSELWDLPVEAVREMVGVSPFLSPASAALRSGEGPRR